MTNTKYHCSVHGGDGDPKCLECRENLRKLCEDNNVYLTGDFE